MHSQKSYFDALQTMDVTVSVTSGSPTLLSGGGGVHKDQDVDTPGGNSNGGGGSTSDRSGNWIIRSPAITLM